LNRRDAGKLACVRTLRTDSVRLFSGRRRWPVVSALVLLMALAAACSKSEYRYVSNSSINTYLKVPSDWKEFKQEELEKAEISAAQSVNQPSSLIDVLVNRQFQWRVAFDADPVPSVAHTLSLTEEPVVEVSVRALDPEEHEQVSLAALRNVLVNYDERKQKAEDELKARAVGVAPQSTSDFRAIDEEELHYEDGVRGIRLRYVLRPDPSSGFYAFDQTTLVDSKAERLYVLLIRSAEAQFIRDNHLFTEIAKSFTVKPKG
jgi:hypothetical protein